MSSRWFTKEDAIKDLSTATGEQITSLSKKFVVVGERPPPPLTRHDEERDQQTLRLCGGYGPHGDNIDQPDLVGITQMIRMVDDFHETFDKEPEVKPVTRGSAIIISKLNPEVPAFVPKSLTKKTPNNIDEQILNDQSTSRGNLNGCRAEILVKDTKNENVNAKLESRTSSKERIDITQLNSEEKNEMKEKLKNKITSTSKTTNYSVRKERNLAIASLIALHCRQPTEEQTKILCTPEYFMNNTVSKDINDLTNTADNEKINSKPTVDSDECTTEISNNCDKKLLVKTPQEMESIKKVQDWLCPEKPLRKDVYLGPITFKRKSKPESPSSDYKKQNKIMHGNIFVPSTYASDLSRTYEDRCKAKSEDSSSVNLWTKLEMDLKAKDDILKKQRLQFSHNSMDTL